MKAANMQYLGKYFAFLLVLSAVSHHNCTDQNVLKSVAQRIFTRTTVDQWINALPLGEVDDMDMNIRLAGTANNDGTYEEFGITDGNPDRVNIQRSCKVTSTCLSETMIKNKKYRKDIIPKFPNRSLRGIDVIDNTKKAFENKEIISYDMMFPSTSGGGKETDHIMLVARDKNNMVTIVQGWQDATSLHVHKVKEGDYLAAMQNAFNPMATTKNREKGMKTLVPETLLKKIKEKNTNYDLNFKKTPIIKSITRAPPQKVLLSKDEALKVIKDRSSSYSICPRRRATRGRRSISATSSCPSSLGKAISHSKLFRKDSTFVSDINKELNRLDPVSNVAGFTGSETNGRKLGTLYKLKKIGKIIGKVANVLESFSAAFGIVSMFMDIIGGGGSSVELLYMRSQFSAVQRKLDNIGVQLQEVKDVVEFSNNAAALIGYENTIGASYEKYIEVTEGLVRHKLAGGKINLAEKNRIENLVKFMEREGLEGAMYGLYNALTIGFAVTEKKTLLSLIAAKSQYNCSTIIPYGIGVYTKLLYGMQALKFAKLMRGDQSILHDPWIKKIHKSHLQIYIDFSKCTRNAKEHGVTDLKLAVNEQETVKVLENRLVEKYVVYRWAAVVCKSSYDVNMWHYRNKEIKYKTPDTDADENNDAIAAYATYLPKSLTYHEHSAGVRNGIRVGVLSYCSSLIRYYDNKRDAGYTKKIEFEEFKNGLLKHIEKYKDYIAAISRIETETSERISNSRLQGWDINLVCADSPRIVFRYTVLILLKTTTTDVDACATCQNGTCLRLSEIDGNEIYCHCAKGYTGNNCDEKIDSSPASDTFMESMNTALKKLRIPSMYDLADRMDDINANINRSKHEIINHLSKTRDQLQKDIKRNRDEINKTGELVMDHVSIVGTKVIDTVDKTTYKILNEMNSQSASLENGLTELGVNLNISIESLKSVFTQLMSSVKTEIMENAKEAENKIMETILKTAFNRHVEHTSIVSTVHLTKFSESQLVLKYWIDEYLKMRKENQNSVVSVLRKNFVNSFLCDLNRFRQSRIALKQMLVGSSMFDSSVWYFMDVIKSPKCQKGYHNAVNAYRTSLLDQLIASYSVIVWVLDSAARTNVIKCPPHITKEEIDFEQETFTTEITTFWSKASCPPFKNVNLVGEGCALYDSKPGMKVIVNCKLRQGGHPYTPVLTETMRSVKTVVCESNLNWNIDASLIACVPPCTDKEGEEYFVSGKPKHVQAPVGYLAVDHQNRSVDTVKCIAMRSSESIVSKFEFKVRFVDINECKTNPCQNGWCTNTVGSYYCTCNRGFAKGPSKACTVEINECKSANVCKNGYCINTVGSYYCRCNQHYVVAASGLACKPQKYCYHNNGGCHHNCVERVGAVNRCTCRRGFKVSARNPSACQDIDECVHGRCPLDGACHNTIGSFRCSKCLLGYRGNGQTCTDIDECQSSNGCDKNARCTNTLGGYRCACDAGFTGNGRSCRIDGKWGAWSAWSSSVTCGRGKENRQRLCDSPPPRYGGRTCLGKREQVKSVSKRICPECTDDNNCGPDQRCVKDKCRGVCCGNECAWNQMCIHSGTHQHRCTRWYGVCKMKSSSWAWNRCTYKSHSWWTGTHRAWGWDCFCYNSDHAYWKKTDASWGSWGCGTKANKYCGSLDSAYKVKPKPGSTYNCY